MATNTGIEVTALRPAASAGDFYVRPEAYDPAVANGLARLSGTMNKKQNAEAKLTAENLHISDSLNNAENLLNFDEYSHMSPAVIANLKELRGRSYANQWRTETEREYNSWRMNSDESGMDFPEFMAGRKSQLAEAFQGDRFMTAGAMGVINETEHNMRATHGGFLDQRMRSDTGVKMTENVTAYMDSMKLGDLRIQDVARQVDDMVKTTNDTGAISSSQGNMDMFQNVVDKYKATGDYDYYLLAGQLRFAKGSKGQINSKAELVLKEAFDSVGRDAARAEAVAAKAATTQLAIDKNKTMVEAYSHFTNTNEPLSEEYKARAFALGITPSQLETQENALRKLNDDTPERGADHSAYAIALDSKMGRNVHNPDGLGVTHASLIKDLDEGRLHPDDYESAMNRMESLQKVTPLLNGPIVKNIKKMHVDKLRDSEQFKSKTHARDVANLISSFDLNFSTLVDQHYMQGSDGVMPEAPQQDELRSMANQAISMSENEAARFKEKALQYDVYVESIVEAADLSAKSTEVFTDDPELDNVSDFVQTPRGKSLEQDLIENPMQMITRIPQDDEGNDLPEIKMEAWKLFDYYAGNGAFGLWYSTNSGIFTGGD